MPWDAETFEPLLSVRNSLNDEAKRRIALAAIAELPPGGSIVVDSGSTLARFAGQVPERAGLRVVTNSLVAAQLWAEHDDTDVMMLGGKVRRNTMAVVDAGAVAAVQRLTVDTAFISCAGMSIDKCLSTPYRGEEALKRAMIGSARRVVALVDHSKFGNDYFLQFAKWSDIDLLITDDEADPAVVARIEGLGTAVVIA